MSSAKERVELWNPSCDELTNGQARRHWEGPDLAFVCGPKPPKGREVACCDAREPQRGEIEMVSAEDLVRALTVQHNLHPCSLGAAKDKPLRGNASRDKWFILAREYIGQCFAKRLAIELHVVHFGGSGFSYPLHMRRLVGTNILGSVTKGVMCVVGQIPFSPQSIRGANNRRGIQPSA